MLKKPLFWIIVVIVIVILWFVFGERGKEDAGLNQNNAAPTAVAPQAAHSTPAASSHGSDATSSGHNMAPAK